MLNFSHPANGNNVREKEKGKRGGRELAMMEHLYSLFLSVVCRLPTHLGSQFKKAGFLKCVT